MNGTDKIFEFDDEVSVQCEDHARYAGSQILVCSDDGVWVAKDGQPLISCGM